LLSNELHNQSLNRRKPTHKKNYPNQVVVAVAAAAVAAVVVVEAKSVFFFFLSAHKRLVDLLSTFYFLLFTFKF